MDEEQIQARWDENVQAIQDAKQAVLDRFRDYNRVRERAAAAARRRNPRYPVLSAEERADMDRARQGWESAKEDLLTAQEQFKSGVAE